MAKDHACRRPLSRVESGCQKTQYTKRCARNAHARPFTFPVAGKVASCASRKTDEASHIAQYHPHDAAPSHAHAKIRQIGAHRRSLPGEQRVHPHADGHVQKAHQRAAQEPALAALAHRDPYARPDGAQLQHLVDDAHHTLRRAQPLHQERKDRHPRHRHTDSHEETLQKAHTRPLAMLFMRRSGHVHPLLVLCGQDMRPLPCGMPCKAPPSVVY